MKVLLVSPVPPPSGGIARWTERYLKWCSGKHEVEVVNTALIGVRSGQAGKKKKIYDELRRSIKILRCTKKAIKNNPDIVHLNTSCSKTGIIRDWLCAREALKKKVPFVLHCHCNIKDQLGIGFLPNILFNNLLRNASIIFVLNENSKVFVESIVGKEKLFTCPNFVLENQLKVNHVINNSINSIIYVGDVRLSKGTDDIFKLAKMLPDKDFKIVGSITDEIKRMQKPKNIILLGRKSAKDVEKELELADIFLFPSLTEGFSNALLEAMAVGLPVIATDVGANKEMIESNGGYIVSVHDILAMKKSIEKMENPVIRKQMSVWNIEKVRSTYTYDKVLNMIFNKYEDII